MEFISKSTLASLILFCSGIASGSQLETELIEQVEYESEINTLSSAAINENAEHIAFITNKELKKGFWVSEVNLLNLKTKNTKVVISSSDLKGYAVYGAFAANPKWLNKSVIQIGVSDGDVGIAQVSFDLERSALKKGEMTDFDDWEPQQQTDISKLFKYCFANTDDSVISSGSLEWLNKGKSAIYQARHIAADYNLWYLDFETCSRQLLLDTGDIKSNDFAGWLAGFTILKDNLIFMLNKSNASNIYFIKLDPSQIQRVTKSVSFKESGWISYIGSYNSKHLFKVKLTGKNYCTTKIIEFDKGEFIEHKFVDRNICEVSLATGTGALTTVSQPIGTESRLLSLFSLNNN